MKNTYKVKLALLLTAVLLISLHLNAQNQSMILPIPGDVAPNPTGSKSINFVDPVNPVITELPVHTFFIDPNTQGDPHKEEDLHIALSLMNEKYLGQHPHVCTKYCSR